MSAQIWSLSLATTAFCLLTITGASQLDFCATRAGVGSSSRETAIDWKPRNAPLPLPVPKKSLRSAVLLE